MIKIDLQRGEIGGEADSFEEKVLSNFDLKIAVYAVFKLLFLILFSLGLYVYEQRELDLLRAILQKKQNIENKIEQEIQKKKISVKELHKVKSQYVNLKNKVFRVKDIAKSRLSFIKAMDSLNAFRPETLWFQEISYAQGLLSARGHAISKNILDEFLKNIRLRPIFKSSLLRESKTDKLKGVNIRSFHLEVRLLN